jgi:hypothetical protein
LEGDVVINEILFNPRTGGPDFIEIFNQGARYVDVRGWRLARYDDDVEGSSVTIGDQAVLPPRSFRVFTTDPIRLLSDYPRALTANVIHMELPSLPDDKAMVAVIDTNDRILDKIQYTESLHSRMIRDPEGVSLERISTTAASLDPSNWRSAAEAAGFATPGFVNSNSIGNSHEEAGQFSVVPEVISPGGSERFALIHYRFDEPGSIVSCRVFNHHGQLVREIANNVSVGYDGFFRWDGDDQDGSVARAGYYVVVLDCFNMEGFMQSKRLRVVIAPR